MNKKQTPPSEDTQQHDPGAEHADSTPPKTPDVATPASAEDLLAQKQLELDELRDKLTRQVAQERNDKEGFITRAKKELETSRRYAITDMAVALLTVADDLERVVAEMQKRGDKESVTGISLIMKNLQDIFGNFEVRLIASKAGDLFNPHHHEAISVQESDEHAKDTLISVAQNGYTLADRVLRPVRVVVAKPKQEKGQEQEQEQEQDTAKGNGKDKDKEQEQDTAKGNGKAK